MRTSGLRPAGVREDLFALTTIARMLSSLDCGKEVPLPPRRVGKPQAGEGVCHRHRLFVMTLESSTTTNMSLFSLCIIVVRRWIW